MKKPISTASDTYDELTLDRKLVKQSPVRDTLYLYDGRLGHVSIAESDLEADRIVQVMCDPDVATYEAQSFSCYPFPDDKKRRYTLDMLVVQMSGEIFEDEIKPKSRTTSPAFVAKHQAIAEYAETQRNAQHRIVTEDDIYIGSLNDNLWFLLPRKSSACPREEAFAFRTATGIGKCTVREAQNHARQHGFDPDIVARCVAHELLPCDLTVDWPEIVVDFAHLQ